MPSTSTAFEYTLRVIESLAFGMHGILGVTEPCTGCLRMAFRDKGAMPTWFWPVSGLLLWVVSYSNLTFAKDHLWVLLIVQGYIAAFHSGAVFYHLRLGHHPATGTAPAVFVVIAFFVILLNTNNIWISLAETILCVGIAYILSLSLIRVKEEKEYLEHDDPNIIQTETTALQNSDNNNNDKDKTVRLLNHSHITTTNNKSSKTKKKKKRFDPHVEVYSPGEKQNQRSILK